MPMPGLHNDFNHRKKNTHRGEKTLGALPVLLVLLHPALEVRHTPPVAVTHQSIHQSFQYAQIAEHLRFEFVYHPHPPDSGSVVSAQCGWSAEPCSYRHQPATMHRALFTVHCSLFTGRLKNKAAENSE